MAEKRRDLRNRVLRSGESQIKQGKFKGRYQYDYIDSNGIRRHCNSWRLTEADPIPSGKRMCKPLRTLEEEIAEAMHDGIDMSAKNKTLNQIHDEIMELNIGIKNSTRKAYYEQWNSNVRDTLGKRKITTVKYSDVKKLYVSLLHDKGLMASSLSMVDKRIKCVFDFAVKDKIISSDPSRGAYRELSKNAPKNEKRHALSKYEQERFLQYCNQKRGRAVYYNMFVVFFGTGVRISELTGLTWSDINFEDNYILIQRGLSYTKDVINNDKKYRFHIGTTKTESSRRMIPMLPEVREALIRQKEIDLYLDKGYSVDGVTDFVFINRQAIPFNTATVNTFITYSVNKINAEEKKRAEVTGTKANYIRAFSVHNCRHTFATRLCEKNVPVKVVQSVMGHTDIQTTLNIYAECTQESKSDVFAKLDGIF